MPIVRAPWTMHMEAHLDEIVLTARSSDRFENKYKFARARNRNENEQANKLKIMKLWPFVSYIALATATDQIKQQPHATTPAQSKITRSFAVWQSILHWAKIDSTIFLFSILISTTFIWLASVCVRAEHSHSNIYFILLG